MARENREKLIKELQNERKSKVIAYLTSTRPGLEVQMAMDVVRLFFDHIQTFGVAPVEQIDLVLHSNGGDGVVPWRLVTLLRERCKKFAVLVPHRAFSAATLTALGADEIVMHPLAMLGPIDPTTANPFNPRDPTNQQQVLGISVEDVAAYVALVKEDVGITHEDELVQAFSVLAQMVHPLALGNVKRTSQQSRMMARKLLALHMDRATEEHRMDQIVEALSSRLYYHGHPINRREAKEDLNLKVQDCSQEVEDTLWSLYMEYEKEMKLGDPYSPALELVASGTDVEPQKISFYRPQEPHRLAYLESETLAHVFLQHYELAGTRLPNGAIQATILSRSQGWTEETSHEPQGTANDGAAD
jgi:hypothetical protein